MTEQSQQSQNRPFRHQASQGTILLVDDTVANLQLLTRMLTRQGYDIRSVTDGHTALTLLDSELPDLILLDVCMPGMDGYEVCRNLKSNPRTEDIPVIFVSAMDEVLNKLRAFDAGGVDYITKPFRVPEVMARIGIHMTLRRLQQQLREQNDVLRQEIRDRMAAESALQTANQELQRLANLDGLTQVANRRRFDEYLEQEWRRMLRDQAPLSLVLCDVDFFKNYNDTYGHQSGDDCLRQLAAVLQAVSKRPADVVARYGGEEFVIILPNTPLDGALWVAEDVRQGIAQLQIEHKGSQICQFVTLSLGVATMIPTAETRPTDLVQLADQALYRAKAEGRDRIVHEG